jgi:dihydrofolate reductase
MTSNAQGPKPRISIIVAYAANRVIGSRGKMPWHLSDDLKRFKQITMGHSIVMGRKTWESIGRILPGRRHVIISRRIGYTAPGATVAASLNEAIAACAGEPEIFVIGGGEIYRLALPLAERIYATEIDHSVDGDTFFPPLDMAVWKEIRRECRREENTSTRYSFVTFERNRTIQ